MRPTVSRKLGGGLKLADEAGYLSNSRLLAVIEVYLRSNGGLGALEAVISRLDQASVNDERRHQKEGR